MDTISGSDTAPSVEEKLAWAEMYLSGGWHLFIVRPTKVTYPQCSPCREAEADHDRERCGHLLCHGFYAATNDIDRIRKMLTNHPEGLLSLRTGQPSGIIALDFESHADTSELPTGTEVYDGWESYTGGIELPKTLMSRSQSGGLHVLYKTEEIVRGRTRVLPSTDIKAEGGYVILPPAPGRTWLTTGLAPAPEALLRWIHDRRGKDSPAWTSSVTGQKVGHATGYDFHLFFRDGCPGGYRDDFINDLLFRLRKNRKSMQEAWVIAHHAWENIAQPPYAKYHMPWSDVEYKLRRVWQTVKPDPLPDIIASWAAQATATDKLNTWGTR